MNTNNTVTSRTLCPNCCAKKKSWKLVIEIFCHLKAPCQCLLLYRCICRKKRALLNQPWQTRYHWRSSRNANKLVMAIIPNTVKFWLYLLPLIPSILASFFALYCLLFDRVLRSGLHNHIPIFLLSIGLFCELTIFPWMLYQFQHSEVWQRSSMFCTIWGFIDAGSFSTQTLLFAWASMQRHILIFHEHWLHNGSMRLILHYLPLLGLIAYSFVYHFIVYFFPPCSNIENHFETICIQPCLFTNQTWALYETLVHRVLPFITMIVFSVLLMLRVIWWKWHRYQADRWQRYRGLTIQISCIVCAYLIFAFPCGIFNILLFTQAPLETLIYWNAYASFFNAYPVLLSPFVCLVLEDRIRHRLRTWFSCKRRGRERTIAPILPRNLPQPLPTIAWSKDWWSALKCGRHFPINS